MFKHVKSLLHGCTEGLLSWTQENGHHNVNLASAQNWKKNSVWEKNNLAQTFKWCDGMNQNLTIRNQRDEQKDSERTWEDTRHCAKVKFNLNLNFLKKREW